MDTNAAGGFPHVILASASPRRLDLLRQAGIEPEVEPSHVVEVIRSTKPDEADAVRMIASFQGKKQKTLPPATPGKMWW